MNRYFIDTEFIESGKCIEPLSICLIKENKKTGKVEDKYYAINIDCDISITNDWVKENVLKHLPKVSSPLYKSKEKIAGDLISFTKEDNLFEMWGWFPTYDWVVIKNIFGSIYSLPNNFPNKIYCLRQWLYHLGLRFNILPKKDKSKVHSAEYDAEWARRTFRILNKIEGTK